MGKVKIFATLPEDVAEILENIVDIAGYQMVVHPVKERVKKEKTLEEVFDEIQRRFVESDFYIDCENDQGNLTLLVIGHPILSKVNIGKAKCRPSDTFDRVIGHYLALCRACKWKDLEQEILSKL